MPVGARPERTRTPLGSDLFMRFFGFARAPVKLLIAGFFGFGLGLRALAIFPNGFTFLTSPLAFLKTFL